MIFSLGTSISEIPNGSKYNIFVTTKGINTLHGKINTGNSAWGALQLANHLGYDKIMLLGVDADRSPRIDGGYPNELCHLPLLFDSANLNVVNCGKMDCKFPKMSIKEGLEWLIS